MNLGGEPERDDFGLPPVDIEIPDDARELDRDVQAYHRELRALRRHLRGRRWRGPLTGDGMVMPLLAGCLIFALIAAVLLTVFAATGDVAPHGPAQASTGPSTIGPAGAQPAGREIKGLAGLLPDKTIIVSGQQVRLRALRVTALALVPPSCACVKALGQLIAQAAASRVPLYLVATPANQLATQVVVTRLRAMATQPSLVQVADDHDNVLATTYRPAGLAVILVNSNGALALAQGLRSPLQLQSQLSGLRQSAGAASSPAA